MMDSIYIIHLIIQVITGTSILIGLYCFTWHCVKERELQKRDKEK